MAQVFCAGFLSIVKKFCRFAGNCYGNHIIAGSRRYFSRGEKNQRKLENAAGYQCHGNPPRNMDVKQRQDGGNQGNKEAEQQKKYPRIYQPGIVFRDVSQELKYIGGVLMGADYDLLPYLALWLDRAVDIIPGGSGK